MWFDELDTMVGVYFLMEDLDVSNRFDTPSNSTLLRYQQAYAQKTRNGSVFGTGTWDFFDDFTLDASVRYSWEYKELDIVSTAIGPGGGVRSRAIADVDSEGVRRGDRIRFVRVPLHGCQ